MAVTDIDAPPVDVQLIALEEGSSTWWVPCPTHWVVVDQDGADWLGPVMVGAAEQRTSWLAEHPGPTPSDDDELDWQLWVQAEIVSAVRSVLDEGDPGILVVGVDLLGDEGATLVSVLDASVYESGPDAASAATEPGSGYDVIRHVEVEGDVTIESLLARTGPPHDAAYGAWTVLWASVPHVLRLSQRTVGPSSDELLGIGNGIAAHVEVVTGEDPP